MTLKERKNAWRDQVARKVNAPKADLFWQGSTLMWRRDGEDRPSISVLNTDLERQVIIKSTCQKNDQGNGSRQKKKTTIKRRIGRNSAGFASQAAIR